MRFLIDENLPPEVASLLVASGHDVYEVSGSSLESTGDDVITAFAAAQGRIVVTMDLDFPLQGAERLPGLILLRPGKYANRSDIAGALAEFMAKEEFQQIAGRASSVAPGRPVRWRRIEDA